MKVLSCLMIMLLASFFVNAQTMRQKVLIYADAGYPPYSYKENNSKLATGIYIDIVQSIFQKMQNKYDISIVPITWQRGIDGTKEGEAFAILPPYKNEKSRPWLSYSEPILTERLAVFCNDSPGKWPESYKEKAVAINYGFVFPNTIFDLLKDNKMILERPKDNKQSLEYLYINKVSCYINDENSVYYSVKLLGLDKEKIYLKTELTSEDGYLAYSNDKKMYPFGESFIHQFNSILLEMKKNNEIEPIIQKFFK